MSLCILTLVSLFLSLSLPSLTTSCVNPSECTGAGAFCCRNKCINCVQLDQCHEPPYCHPTMGTCANPSKPSGTLCDDSNLCTSHDVCTNGVCSGTPIVCPLPDQCHTQGTCNPSTGQCTQTVRGGRLCNDGNVCTLGDICNSNGQCVGNPKVCSKPLSQCLYSPGTCDTLGNCVFQWKPDNTSCNDFNGCTVGDQCVSGVCVGQPKRCITTDACYLPSGSCWANGYCSFTPRPFGTSCDDGDPCTANDSCTNGLCIGVPISCVPGICVESSSCVNGVCVDVPATNAGCDDGNDCTYWDNCNQSGVCVGYPMGNGVTCDDGNACTRNDQCLDVHCVGDHIPNCIEGV